MFGQLLSVLIWGSVCKKPTPEAEFCEKVPFFRGLISSLSLTLPLNTLNPRSHPLVSRDYRWEMEHRLSNKLWSLIYSSANIQPMSLTGSQSHCWKRPTILNFFQVLHLEQLLLFTWLELVSSRSASNKEDVSQMLVLPEGVFIYTSQLWSH